MAAVKGPVLYDFEVSHPDYPRVTVSNIGADSASIQAAKERWGLTAREWAGIAAYITVRKVGVTLKPRCRKCGKELAGHQAGLCPDCARVEEQYRRDMAKIRSKDPRAEYRGKHSGIPGR